MIFSKWPEVFCTKSQTFAQTIDYLRIIFAHFGLPLQLVSNNAHLHVMNLHSLWQSTGTNTQPQLRSTQPQMGWQRDSSRPSKGGSKHPNEMEEPCRLDCLGSWHHTGAHHTSPQVRAQQSWCLDRDLMKPRRHNMVLNKQANMMHGGWEHQVTTGQEIVVRDHRRGWKWAYGIVQAQIGPRSYEVRVGPNMVWRRHTDQMHPTGDKLHQQSHQ